MYLGFDVSTSVVGWSILDRTGNLEKWGYVKFPTKLGTDLFLKMDYFASSIKDVLNEYKDKIEVWAVEEAVKKFQGGKSSANTIFVCASFNFGVSYEAYKILGKEPEYIPVSTARKMVGIKIPRYLDKKEKKTYIVEQCMVKYPTVEWGLTRNDTYQSWCFDVADSLVISEAARLKHGS